MSARKGSAAVLEPAVVLASGCFLWAILVQLDRGVTALAGTLAPNLPFATLSAPVAVEEAAKLCLFIAFMIAERPLAGLRLRLDPGPRSDERDVSPRWPGLALATIAVFGTFENLAYLSAFSSAGIVGRLFWSLPVHVAGAMAVIAALSSRRSLVAPAFLFAAGWHLGANALASSSPSAAVLIAGSVLSVAAIVVLSRLWFRNVVLEGIVHATARKH